MDADGRAVVAGMNLSSGSGRVALVAQSLALVGTDADLAVTIEHFGEREFGDGDEGEFAAVK